MSLPPPNTVMVSVAEPYARGAAVRWAAAEAKRRGADLVLVDIRTRAVDETIAEDRLEDALSYARATAPGIPISRESVVGREAAELVGLSHQASLMVLGRGPAEPEPWPTVLPQVAAHAGCPVAVVPGHQPYVDVAPEVVVVGVDTGPAGQPAIQAGFEEAEARGVPLLAVRAFTAQADLPGPNRDWPQHHEDLESAHERLLAEALAGWDEKFPDVRVVTRVVRREPARALFDVAREASLLVVGARGAGGFPALALGSTTDSLVRLAPCPLLVVH